jgi:uncharacterized membrane protein
MFFIAIHQGGAQSLKRQTISSTGGSIHISGGMAQLSIGQPSNTVSITDGQVRMQQGFIQPIYKISKSETKSSFKVFPNPAYQNVQITGKFTGTETICLTSMQGQKVTIETEFLNNKHVLLNISQLAAGPYALQISNKSRILQSIILIKTP